MSEVVRDTRDFCNRGNLILQSAELARMNKVEGCGICEVVRAKSEEGHSLV